jgi:hypothetical protein
MGVSTVSNAAHSGSCGCHALPDMGGFQRKDHAACEPMRRLNNARILLPSYELRITLTPERQPVSRSYEREVLH